MKQQELFGKNPARQKLFTLTNLTNRKLRFLHSKMESLNFQELAWLSKVEDFFFEKDYITEKQVEVLDSLMHRHLKNSESLSLGI